MIAFDGLRILHTLEGRPQEVGRMFGRILQDRRYRGVTEPSRHRVGERSFPGTGMGIVPIVVISPWSQDGRPFDAATVSPRIDDLAQ